MTNAAAQELPNSALRAAISIVVSSAAFFICVKLFTERNALYFPLSGGAAALWAMPVTSILSGGGVGYILLFRRTGPCWLLLLGGLAAAGWLACYSSLGAFVPQIIYNCLFFAAAQWHKKDDRELPLAGALFFSLIFGIAAIQKLNLSYLSGSEFTSPLGFLSQVHQYFGAPPAWLTVSLLPSLSIAVELTLSIGLLFRPQLFAHASIVFVLLISFLHPPVLYVYLSSVSLLFVTAPASFSAIPWSAVRRAYSNPFVLFAFLMLVRLGYNWSGKDALAYFSIPWSMSSLLLGFHLWLGWQSRQSFDTHFRIRPFAATAWRRPTTFVLLFVAMTPLVGLLGAPTPIGFTMFSGRIKPEPGHQLRIQHVAVCDELERRFVPYITTDVVFAREHDSCVIAGPSESGALFVAEQLCNRFSNYSLTLISLRHDVHASWTAYQCDLGNK